MPSKKKKSQKIVACPPVEKDDRKKDIAIELLKIDYQKSFDVHEDYKKIQINLIQLSIKIISFPIIVMAALMSAKIISGQHMISDILEIEAIWYSCLVSGIINIITLRKFIVTDKVQTEAKHHINKIRGLYLDFLQDTLPDNWQPTWGKNNKYLNRRIKLKGAALTSIILGSINSLYISFALYKMGILKQANIFRIEETTLLWIIAFVLWIIQQEIFISNLGKIEEYISNKVKR
jgi:hypothetical protein